MFVLSIGIEGMEKILYKVVIVYLLKNEEVSED